MSKVSVREYAVDFIGKGKKSVSTTGGGNVVLTTGVHALDGPEHTHLDSYVKSTLGGEETVADTVTGAAVTIDAADGNWADIALTADCTVTVTGFTSGFGCSVLVRVTQDAGAGHAIIWDADVVFQSGVDDQPGQGTLEETWFVLWSMDGDGSIRAAPVGGGGGSMTFATPAIVLGTAAAAGIATTVIRSDSTIVAFDATVPVTQAVGDSAATGSAAVAARRDHKHAVTRPSLDDLSDVTITSVAAGQRVRYNGSAWVNTTLHWQPMVDYTGLVMLDSAGNPSEHEVL